MFPHEVPSPILYCCFSHSVVSDSFAIPWTVACQNLLSMRFLRQEYWSGLPLPPQVILLIQGLNPHLLHRQADSLPMSHHGNPHLCYTFPQNIYFNLSKALGCKEIQPVHPKGDQSWVFIGRTDVEAETPILWPPDVKS